MNRGESQQPFSSPGEALEHHGVKGMKWGVRKEEESSGDGGGGGTAAKQLAAHNEQTKMYLAAANRMPTPKTYEEGLANLRTNQEKFAGKFASSDGQALRKGSPGQTEGTRPHLTPQQKKTLLYVGGGAVAIGGAYFAGKYLKNNVDVFKVFQAIEPTSPKKMAEIERLAGKHVDPKTFNGLVGFSQGKTWWGGNYLTEAAFARPEFELPAGHTFYRVSTSAEKKFGYASQVGQLFEHKATYCTASADDFNRYIAGFRQEKGLAAKFYEVTFKSKSPVKVPNLTTVLGELHGALEEEAGRSGSYFHKWKITPDTVTQQYTHLSGSGWTSELGQSLMGRLKARGYGAIVDEMDAGVIGENPLVFFGDNTTKKTSKPLAAAAIKHAESLLTEIPNPPGRKY